MGEAVVFHLAPGESLVRIHATSNVHPIHGEAVGLDGRITLTLRDGQPDLDESIEATVELAVADLSSENIAYDTEMRRRLDARRHPKIGGVVTAVEGLDAEGLYRVSGHLTFHGVTRAVTTDMVVRFPSPGRLEASWEQTIDIRDFDLKPPRILIFKVDPEVHVEVELVAVRE